ncbi:hypothetical protein BDR06DRAFT_974134 [Suillus hirtellus]|nr:hypothetical protein BDR06DRAFT_974134 [Suillus hirtellus]
MPPRKGKRKAAADTDSDDPDVASSSNTFRLNTRPVEATLPTSDAALEIQRLDAGVNNTIIGIGKINILAIENTLKFGTYNDRLLNKSEVNKMVDSFEKYGLQWMKESNALPIVIERSRIAPGQALTGSWTDANTLEEVVFQDVEPLICASGQHRVAALRKMAKSHLDEQEEIEKSLARLEAKGAITSNEVEEHNGLRIRLSRVKGFIATTGVWAVILYDKAHPVSHLDVARASCPAYIDTAAHPVSHLDVARASCLAYIDTAAHPVSHLDVARASCLAYIDTAAHPVSHLDVARASCLAYLDTAAHPVSHLDVARTTASGVASGCGDISVVLILSIDMIEAGKGELAKHLSRNQTLHNYRETSEERLVYTLRNMQDGYREGGREGALQELEMGLALPDNSANSKLTKVMMNDRLMLTLMHAILPLGPHYRKRRELSVRWLSQAMNVIMGMYTFYMSESSRLLRKFASKSEDFPTYQEVLSLVEQSDTDQHAQTALSLLVDKMQAAEEGDLALFVPVMDEIDKLAIKCFDTYEECIGDGNDDYIFALTNYRDDVVRLLEKQWLIVTERSKDELLWLQKVIARIYVWLTPCESCTPPPLMTGMVMDRVWKELESVKQGYIEIARWFECMLHSMKIMSPNTHAIDDVTESMLCSIERTRGMNGKLCAADVWLFLFHERMASVLHLHNVMSAIGMQAKMDTRPTTKANFDKEWASMSKSTQENATVLFKLVKKFVGRGNIDVPVSSMNTLGMPAFVSTGWDWRRPAIRKNMDRSVEPSVRAIIMELEFAQTYRRQLLQDHQVWKLRDQLHEYMFWDGIIVPEPPAESDITDDTHVNEEDLLRRRTVVTTHRNELLTLVAMINKMTIARVTAHKDSALDYHVAYHGNKFIRALESSASRLRLRNFSGIETAQFDDRKHYESLEIPALEGVRDTYTLYTLTHWYKQQQKEDLDEEKDLNAAAGSHPEEPLPEQNLPKPTRIPTTLTFRDKGKAKATTPDPVIEPEDIPVIAVEQEDTPASVLQAAHIPVSNATVPDPRDLFSTDSGDSIAVVDARTLVDPTVLVSHVDLPSDVSAPLLRQVTGMDVDPESPLSSHHDGASDADMVLHPDVTLQTDTALVAELDALDAKRRSCSVRSSVVPSEISLSSKRSRNDPMLFSPDNKKKRKSKSKSKGPDNSEDVDMNIPDL